MANLIQNNFISGEISPSLHGRSDLKAYYSAAAGIKNFIVGKEGSLRKRRGLRAYDTIHGGAFNKSNSRIFPYFHDKDGGGVVLVSNGSVGVYAHLYGKVGLTSPSATSVDYIASAEIHDDELTVEQFRSLRAVQVGDTLFFTCKGVFFSKAVVTYNPSGTSSIAVTGYAVTAKPVAPTSITFSSTYFHDWSESAAPDYAKTVRYATWLVRDGVMSARREAACRWHSNWTSGSYIDVTVTPGTDDFDYIVLGKGFGGSWGEVARWYPEDVSEVRTKTKETCSTSGTTATVIHAVDEIVSVTRDGTEIGTECAFSGTTVTFPTPDDPSATYTYAIQYYYISSQTKICSWRDENCTPGDAILPQTDVLSGVTIAPACCNVYQQRLALANFPDFPMTFAFSEIGNLYNFWADRPTADDDPFSPTLSSTGPAFVRWLVPYQKSLIAFTDAGIYAVAGSASEGFCSRTCQMNRISEIVASDRVAPIETDYGIIFVGHDDKTLYTMAYDITTDQTIPLSQMNLAEHLGRGATIVSTAVQRYPFTVVWCVLSDGTLLSLTYDRAQEVSAWSRHSVDGYAFAEVACIGSVSMDSTANDGRTYSDIVFTAHPSTGSTLFFATFRQHQFADVGFSAGEQPVVATLTTLRAEAQDKTIAGLRKNVKDVIVRLHESGPLKLRPADTSLAWQTLAASATAASPFTGEAKAAPMGYVNADGQMTFVSDTATNCEITGVIYRMEINQ